MKNLLIEIKRVTPHASFHVGDLDWWVFYNTTGETPQEMIRLWEDEHGKVVGWMFSIARDCYFDLIVHPVLRGSQNEVDMLAWIDNHLTAVALNRPDSDREGRSVTAAVFADNATQMSWLESHGYERSEFIVYFARTLVDDIPEPCLPDGFVFLPTMREEYADRRADVHANSFNPSRMTTDYYRGFMKSPGYHPELDIVTVAPDGRFASFAMGWIDSANKISTFEPVGTRNIFQRKGLGRATLLEGMRRLQASGMELATVGCNANIPGNLAFYRSVGFEIANRLFKYTKTL